MLFPEAVQGLIQFTSSYNGTVVKGLVGSSVNFTWGFSGNVGIIYWGLKKSGVNDFLINGKLVMLHHGGSTLLGPPQYAGRVSGSHSSGQAIFTLSSITTADERVYGCRLQPPTGFDDPRFDFVRLVVEEEPKITRPVIANESYNEGSPVDISCEATGTPVPNVMWIHDGQMKSFGSKTAHLKFSTISKIDAGKYTCRANNSAGRTEKQVNLVINCE